MSTEITPESEPEIEQPEIEIEEPEMFTCKCGEHEYPIDPATEDESVWCECGLRIDEQRQRILDARH